MFSKTHVYVTYFVDSKAHHTEKTFFGRISDAIKIGTDEEGKNKYEFESWNARFVGKAKEKAEKLEDKTVIILTSWNARNPYSKEKERAYPHIVVMDFEISEKTEE